MSSPRRKRPCVIPQVQIDTWGKSGTGSAQYTCAELAAELFTADLQLVSRSLLRSCLADTVPRIAQCIAKINSPICPYVSAGQIYLRPEWRVRWADMGARLQDMVLHLKYDATDPTVLQQAFQVYYNPTALISIIYDIIGPARSAGVQSMLSLPMQDSLAQ